MELLLVRHALPVRRQVEVGAADPELADEGHAQARLLADYLDLETIDAVYSSPLRRAIQTATPLAERKQLDLVIEPDVAEWDQKSNEYIPVEEMKRTNHPQWQAMVAGTWTVEDESPEEFNARVVGAVERIIDRHPGQRVAIVCHGGVLSRYLAHVLGLPGHQQGFFYPNYTSIHRVAAARSGERSIVTINETSHLRGSGLPIGLFQR